MSLLGEVFGFPSAYPRRDSIEAVLVAEAVSKEKLGVSGNGTFRANYCNPAGIARAHAAVVGSLID